MQAFRPVTDVTNHWKDFPAPWFVAGGWAIDLFLGRVTRDHHDVELAIFRQDQALLRESFRDWAWQVCRAPGVLSPWDGDFVTLPLHQFQATPTRPGAPSFDVLLNDRAGDTWHFRRDPAVTRLVTDLVRKGPGGVPYLRPEITLLYKAKYQRPQDEADFRLTLPDLAEADRMWLKAAIATAHPGHPWLEQLQLP